MAQVRLIALKQRESSRVIYMFGNQHEQAQSDLFILGQFTAEKRYTNVTGFYILLAMEICSSPADMQLLQAADCIF